MSQMNKNNKKKSLFRDINACTWARVGCYRDLKIDLICELIRSGTISLHWVVAWRTSIVFRWFCLHSIKRSYWTELNIRRVENAFIYSSSINSSMQKHALDHAMFLLQNIYSYCCYWYSFNLCFILFYKKNNNKINCLER